MHNNGIRRRWRRLENKRTGEQDPEKGDFAFFFSDRNRFALAISSLSIGFRSGSSDFCVSNGKIMITVIIIFYKYTADMFHSSPSGRKTTSTKYKISMQVSLSCF